MNNLKNESTPSGISPKAGALAKRLPRWSKVAIVIAVLLLAGGIVYLFNRAPDTAQKPGATGAGRFGADPSRAQPVAAVPAKTGDINIVQDGLGTVMALKTVTVKARVDGQLQSVAFREGQLAQQGEVLAEIDPKPLQAQLSQVEGQLARDQALLANAHLDVERYRTLFAQDSVAKQQLDAQESLVHQYEGTVKADQGQVDNAKLQLGYTRITAPITGRLGLRQVDAGNMIHASDANGLVVITQIDPITVIFTIPQDNLQRVLKQLKAGEKLGVDAWDREQKVKLAAGFLLTVDNQIDVTTGTVKLKAQFPNPDGNLFPNQFVNVRMVVDTVKGATLVPTAAVQRGSQGTIVYVVKEDKSVSMRPVKLGPVEGDNVAVESGVKPGDLVVVDGIDRLREGAKVEVSSPAPAKAGPRTGRDPTKRGAGRKSDEAGPSQDKDGKPGKGRRTPTESAGKKDAP
jgi:membrane fusion protein, multidrug efflux system